MKTTTQYSLISSIAACFIFLFLAMPVQASTLVDIGVEEPAAPTLRHRLTEFTLRIKPIVEATVIVAAACTFLAGVMYASIMYTESHHLERSRLKGTETFGDIVIGMRKYGWCDGMRLHPQHDFMLLAFSCFLTTSTRFADQLTNAWGNQSIDTTWFTADVNAALNRLKAESLESDITVSECGAIQGVRTYKGHGHHTCSSGDCVRVLFAPSQHPEFKVASLFERALLWLQAPNRASSGRELLQVGAGPLTLLEQHVQGDRLVRDALMEAFEAFYTKQCPDLTDLKNRMHSQYSGIFGAALVGAPTNVALSFWYASKAAPSRVTAQFVPWQAQGNGTCHFHSNHTLDDGADARITLAPKGWLHLRVGHRVLDMLAPTVTEELTESEGVSESPSLKLSDSRTISSSMLDTSKKRWIYWGLSNPLTLYAAEVNTTTGLPLTSSQRALSGMPGINTGGGLYVDPYYNKMYWGDGNVIYVADINATNPQRVNNVTTLFTVAQKVNGVAVDALHQKIYWSSDVLRVGLINPAIPLTPTNITDVNSSFLFNYISFDLYRKKMYFSAKNGSAFSADINQEEPASISNVKDLNLGSGSVDDMAVTPDGKSIYWLDRSGVGTIWFKSLIGSDSRLTIANGKSGTPGVPGTQGGCSCYGANWRMVYDPGVGDGHDQNVCCPSPSPCWGNGSGKWPCAGSPPTPPTPSLLIWTFTITEA